MHTHQKKEATTLRSGRLKKHHKQQQIIDLGILLNVFWEIMKWIGATRNILFIERLLHRFLKYLIPELRKLIIGELIPLRGIPKYVTTNWIANESPLIFSRCGVGVEFYPSDDVINEMVRRQTDGKPIIVTHIEGKIDMPLSLLNDVFPEHEYSSKDYMNYMRMFSDARSSLVAFFKRS